MYSYYFYCINILGIHILVSIDLVVPSSYKWINILVDITLDLH